MRNALSLYIIIVAESEMNKLAIEGCEATSPAGSAYMHMLIA